MSTPDVPLVAGTGPRHEPAGAECGVARMGRAWIDMSTWTGCNGQTCGRDCGPGRSARLWVPCRFAVGTGHSHHLTEREIAALQAVLGMHP